VQEVEGIDEGGVVVEGGVEEGEGTGEGGGYF